MNKIKSVLNGLMMRRKLMTILAAVILACGAAAIFAVRAYDRRQPVDMLTAQPSAIAGGHTTDVAQTERPSQRAEVEVLTVRPHGFEPKEITRPRGPFLLAIANRGEFKDMDLRLDRVTGGRLHQVRMPKGDVNSNEVIDLPPGQYLLTEADHPEWSCRITITPQ